MFSLGAVAASENIISEDNGGDFGSLSSDDAAEIDDSSKMLKLESIDDADILNSSNDDKVGSENNYQLKTDVMGGTFEDIQTAISNTSSNGTVFLNGQNYSGNKNPITIDRNITIDGASSSNSGLVSVLDANKLSGIFVSDGIYHINLKNIILENALFNGQGYFAYFKGGYIALNNVIIRNQNVKSTDSTSAIYIGKESVLNASDVTFANNTISNNNFYGAFIYIAGQSNVSISNLNFYDSNISATDRIDGGILYLEDNCSVNIENINYYGNLLNAQNNIYGSLIRANTFTNISVKNLNFNNNEVISKTIYGGIYLANNCTADIDNFNFTENKFDAKKRLYGGGLYSVKDNEVYMTNIKCDDNIFVLNNTEENRGVLIFGGYNSLLNISDIAFNNNNATGYEALRGMIRIDKDTQCYLDTLKFYNNYFNGTLTFSCAFHSVGGVYVDMKNIFIENNCVDGPDDGTRNQAGFVGIQGRGIVSECHAFNNTVNKAFGGIIRLQSITLEQRLILENSTFIGTSLKVAELDCDQLSYQDHGGVVCVAGEDTGAIIRNCRFENNFNSLGGALGPHNHCLIETCTFINNTATKFYGGAISTFYGNLSTMDVDNRTITVKDCYFEGNTAPLAGAIQANGNEIHIYGCTFVNNTAAKGGAIFLYGDTIDVHNSTFIENHATDDIPGVLIGTIDWGIFDWSVEGGAAYIYGSYSHLFNNTLRYNVASGKENKSRGGAIYVHGNHTLIELTHFDDNFAYGGNGSAVYVYGFNTTIKKSEFFNHSSSRGTVYIFGNESVITNSTFEHNMATSGGGAIYIYGDYASLDANYFNDNNATIHGGAIHTHGDHVKITNSEFYYNNAIPHPEDIEQGLGGAIFISGNNNEISQSIFDRNTARNGSAIYNRGVNLHITDDDFLENQAYSYLLITTATPQSSYYNGSNQVLINITLIGGDNIINAIYHDDLPENIFFHNVTYEHSTGTRTTTDDEIHPADGAENSKGGSIIYQDSREDLQNVTLLIVKNKDSNSNVLTAPATVSGDIIVDTVLKTGLYGNATYLVNDNLSVGTYSVYAEHPEDRLYKQIENETQFRIDPQADLEITKTVSNSKVNPGDLITWTIKVVNKGPTYSQNVIVYDSLPDGLIYVSDDSEGKYDENTGKWSIGYLDDGASAVLNIKAIVNASNRQITNKANVTGDTYDPNETNNNDSETITITTKTDVSVIKNVSKTDASIDDIVIWTITVTNHGPEFAENVLVSEVLPSGLKLINFKASVGSYSKGVWNVGTLDNGTSETLELTTKVTILNGKIKNIASVTTDSYDSNKTNNNDSKTVNVKSLADLELTKQVNVKKVKIGDIIIWTITVTNNGPNRAVNVRVSDLIVEGKAEYVSSQVSKGTFDGFIWIIGDLDVGESATLILKTKALTSGEIINFAIVVSDTPDPDKSNNNDSAIVEVEDGDGNSSLTSSGVKSGTYKTLPATGNPILMVILALFTIVSVSLKRKY